jgi:NAD(P)H-hydrate repair Nnr-like enzyme with NAD(P)H-hydrate dehydratase domain
LQDFCRKYGVTVLLKGATTLISDGKECYLSDSGAPGMAKAGSGDVLSGVLAGLFAREQALSVSTPQKTTGETASNLAQGATPNLSTPLLAAIGAYVAGVAGELAQAESNPYSALPTDTIAALKRAVTQIYNAAF